MGAEMHTADIACCDDVSCTACMCTDYVTAFTSRHVARWRYAAFFHHYTGGSYTDSLHRYPSSLVTNPYSNLATCFDL